MHSLFMLMLVPLIVWLSVWAYLWSLDGKIKRLQATVERAVSEGENVS